jgi:hypothetical protein
MPESLKDPLHLLLCDTQWTESSLPDSDSDLDHDPEQESLPQPPSPSPELSVYQAWLASRVPSRRNGSYSTAGAQRPLTRANLRLAQRIAELCVPQILQIFWSRHPARAFIMVAFSFIRGTFPVFKGYTHALIINEVQSLISSGHYTWSHLIRLVGAEFLRLAAEKSLDSFAYVSLTFGLTTH